jgi:hypothetical protein
VVLSPVPQLRKLKETMAARQSAAAVARPATAGAPPSAQPPAAVPAAVAQTPLKSLPPALEKENARPQQGQAQAQPSQTLTPRDRPATAQPPQSDKPARRSAAKTPRMPAALPAGKPAPPGAQLVNAFDFGECFVISTHPSQVAVGPGLCSPKEANAMGSFLCLFGWVRTVAASGVAPAAGSTAAAAAASADATPAGKARSKRLSAGSVSSAGSAASSASSAGEVKSGGSAGDRPSAAIVARPWHDKADKVRGVTFGALAHVPAVVQSRQWDNKAQHKLGGEGAAALTIVFKVPETTLQ